MMDWKSACESQRNVQDRRPRKVKKADDSIVRRQGASRSVVLIGRRSDKSKRVEGEKSYRCDGAVACWARDAAKESEQTCACMQRKERAVCGGKLSAAWTRWSSVLWLRGSNQWQLAITIHRKSGLWLARAALKRPSS